MRTGFFFAFRYLFSKKTTNAINIISGISVVAFLVGSAALIIILSALNGFEGLVTDMIGTFDPPLKIVATQGKTFELNQVQLQKARSLGGIAAIEPVLEENGVITYDDAQEIVRLKGISQQYVDLIGMDTLVVVGNSRLRKNETDFAIFGSGEATRLNVNTSGFQAAQIFIPNKESRYNPLNPEESLNSASVFPAGIFMLQEDIEKDYVLIPYKTLQTLLKTNNNVSSLDVFIHPGKDAESLKKQLKAIFGNNCSVLDRREQNKDIFKIFNSEKWATYLILLFILIVASFNMIGALTMLVLEKKKDIAVLIALGYNKSHIRSIFLQEGLLLALIGGAIGLIIGLLFCWLQLTFGFIPLENSVVESYPVKIKWPDVLLVWITIVVLGVLSSLYPAINAPETKEVKLS